MPTYPARGTQNWAPVLQTYLDGAYAALTKVTAGPLWTPDADFQAHPLNPAIVAIGDSITDNNETNTPYTGSTFSRTAAYRGDGYYTMAMILAGQPCSIYDVGISGQKASDGLARFDTDVTPFKPLIVIEAFGTNDISGNRTAADTFADKLAMWNKAWAFGAKVIATNCPPRNTFTTTQAQEAQRLNATLRRYAASRVRDFVLVDWYSMLADPINDGYLSTLHDSAGVHPNTLGALTVAPAFATAINGFLPDLPSPLPTQNLNDTTNLMTDPLFTTARGTGNVLGTMTGDVVGGGWTGNSTATSAVGSIVARGDGFGNWQQFAVTGTGSTTSTKAISGWTAGTSILQAIVDFETDAAGWTDGGPSLSIDCTDAASQNIQHASALSRGADTVVQGRIASGVLLTPPIQVPTGTTTIKVQISLTNAGTVRFGRIAVRELPQS